MAYGTFAFGEKAGQLTPDSINSLKLAISGLNKEQAALALSTRGLSEAQQKQVLVDAGLIATNERMSAGIVKQALVTNGLDKEQQEAILTKAGLMHEDSKLLLSGEAVSAQKLKQVLIENGYQAEQAETLINSILQEGQNYKEALSWKVLGTKAKEAAIAMLHNPITWIVAAIASIGLLVKGYDAVIGKQEKLSRQKIEGLDEDISKLDEEIKTLEELQSKLEDAKGSRYELSQIQTELNDAIGETKGLLNGESKAWDVANAKLKANIELKKQQRKQAQQDRVNESKDLYDSNSMEIDWRADLSGDKAREYAEALSWMNGKSFDEFYGSDDYNKLTSQQQSLLWEAVGFKNSYTEEWSNYWKEQIDTAYDVFEETISNYDGAGGQDFIKGLISDMVQDGASLSEISDVVTQVINNQDMQDAINKYWESLVNPDINSEEALQAVKKIFDDIVAKNPELKDFFDNFYNGIVAGGKAATDTSSDVNKMTDSLENLNKALDSIQSAYDKVKSAIDEYNEQGYLSVDTYQELLSLEPEYLRYLMDEEGNLRLGTDAMNEYTSALIDNMAQKQMEKIINYVASLDEQKRETYLAKQATDDASMSLVEFAAATMAANFAAGDLSAQGLQNLTNMLNSVANWAEAAKAGIGQGGISPAGKSAKDTAKELAEAKQEYAEKVADINEDLAEKEQQFAEDMAEAWKEEHLEQLKDGLAKHEDIINRYKKNLEITDFGLDLISEDDFGGKSDLLTKKIEQLTNYGIAMREEFERVASIIPQTGDEAQELANRLEELGNDMRDNVATLRETKVAIQQLRIDAFTSVADDRIGQLEQELNNIDRRIEILNADNKDDFKYTNKLLNMQGLLPSYSDFNKVISEKKRQDRKLIDQEQDTQDTINSIVTKALEMQAKENAEAREKERQNLIKDMEKARKDAAEKLAEAQKDYQEFLDENQKSTEIALQNIEDKFNNVDLTPNTSPFMFAIEEMETEAKSAADRIGGYFKNTIPSLNGGDFSIGVSSGSSSSSYGSGGIPTGAAVYFKSSNPAGHVGIYGGDGYVYHNESGKIRKNTLDEMAKKGYTYRGFGWNGGVSLSSEDASKVAEVAKASDAYGITAKNGYCQAWVADVYAKATGKARSSKATATAAGDAWIVSTGLSNSSPFSFGINGSTEKASSATVYLPSLNKNVTLPSDVTKWRPIAKQALDITGQYSEDNLNLLLYQMLTESSGNEKAINNWDSNAEKGTPSKGLMQVIDPTFKAHALEGYDKDVYDPLSNIIASIRYTVKRYGSLQKGWKGKGYASGTSFHPGGLALVGDENFLNGSNVPSPEMAVYPNGNVEVLGTNGAEIRNLPRGTQVLSNDETKSLLSKIPSYANGTTYGWEGEIESWVLDMMKKYEPGSVERWRGNSPDAWRAEGDTVISVSNYWGSDEEFQKAGWSRYIVEKHLAEINSGISDLEGDLMFAIREVSSGELGKAMSGYWEDSEMAQQIKEINESVKEIGLEETEKKYGKLTLANTYTYHDGDLPGAGVDSWNYVTDEMYYKAHTSNYDYMHTPETLWASSSLTLDQIQRNREINLKSYGLTPEEEKKIRSEYNFRREKILGNPYSLESAIFDLFSTPAHAKHRIKEIEEQLAYNERFPESMSDGMRKKLETELQELTNALNPTINLLEDKVKHLDPMSFSYLMSDYVLGNKTLLRYFTQSAEDSADEGSIYVNGKSIHELQTSNDSIHYEISNLDKSNLLGFDEEGNEIEGYSGNFGVNGNLVKNEDGSYSYNFSDSFTGLSFDWDSAGNFIGARTNDTDGIISIADLLKDPVEELENLPDYVYKVLTQYNDPNYESTVIDGVYYGSNGMPLSSNSSNSTSEDVSNSTQTSQEINDIDVFWGKFSDLISRLTVESRIISNDINNNKFTTDDEKIVSLYNLSRSIGSEAAKIGSEIYEEANNAFNDWLKKTTEDPSLYSQETYDAYCDLLDDILDKTYEFEKDMVERESNFISQLFDAIENKLSDYEDSAEETIKSLELHSSKFASKQTLLQSHFDVLNNIAEAQHDIDTELKASKTMYEYLDEGTRKLLFNQTDYNKLSKELNEIQEKAMVLQTEYLSAISGATEENIDDITSQYEMQYETLMKSYEISKAELEVAKKRQQLDNVLNERNVRMFINGQWQWVANTQDVISAQNELAEAKFSQSQAETSLTQTLELNALQSAQDLLSTEINNINKKIKVYRETWEEIQESINDDGEDFSEILNQIATVDSPKLQNILIQFGDFFSDLYKDTTGENLKIPQIDTTVYEYDADTDYYEKILNAPTLVHAMAYNKLRNAKIDGEKLDEVKLSEERVKYLWNNAREHADGTASTISGWSLMGEKKDELFINANGHLIPINQPTVGNLNAGGIVFNREQMASARAIWNMANIGKVDYNYLKDRFTPQTIEKTIDNRIIINGMTVDSGSADGQVLINALRRYVGNH